MQKKNEALQGKQGGKSGRSGCPAPLGPSSANPPEAQKENHMAQQWAPQLRQAVPPAASGHPIMDPNGFAPQQNGIELYRQLEYSDDLGPENHDLVNLQIDVQEYAAATAPEEPAPLTNSGGVTADPYQLREATIVEPMPNGDIIRDSTEIAEMLTFLQPDQLAGQARERRDDF